MRLSLFLGTRYLRRHPLRQVLSLAGIALSVATATAVVLSDRSIVLSYRDLLDSLAGRAELQVVGLSEGGVPTASLERIRAVEGIAAAVPVVRSPALLLVDEAAVPALVYGVDPVLEPWVRKAPLMAGRLPAGGERRAVALGESTARALGGLAVGDRVALEGARRLATLEVVGLLDDASDLGRATFGHYALLSLPAAHELFARPGFDRVDLRLAEGADPRAAAAGVQAALGSLVRVDTPRGQGRDREHHLRSLEILMALAGFIAGFAGLSILASNRAVSIRERRTEIASLRLLGARRRDVLRMLMTETLVLGLVGTLLGLAAGRFATRAIAGWAARDFLATFNLQTDRLVVEPATLALLFLGGLLATLATTLPPVLAALREVPVLAVRQAAGERREAPPRAWRAAWPALLAGGGLLVLTGAAGGRLPGSWTVLAAASAGFMALLYGCIGLLPALLALRPRAGSPGSPALRFGIDAVARSPRRAALMVVGLALPLAMLVGIGAIAASQRGTVDHWFVQRIRWDFAILRSNYTVLGSQEELPADLLGQVGEVSGVRRVSPQKFGVVGIAGQQATLWVLDTRHVPGYSDLTLIEGDETAALSKLIRGGAALVSLPLARRYGLELGGVVRLETPSGPRPFEVAGIIEELGSANGTVQIDWRDYRRLFGGGFSQLVMQIDPGADPDRVRNGLEGVLKRYPGLQLQSSSEFYEDVFSGLDSFYRLLDGLIGIALATACLALVNGLFLSILERRRSLALGRVCGMLRRQVLAAVVWEALICGAWAGAVGIAVGLAFGLASVATAGITTGVTLSFRFPLVPTVLAVLFALVVAPLCALPPGRQAAARLPLTLLSEP